MRVTKLYFRDASSPVYATMPGATNVAGRTITTTATGASTNRQASPLIGAAQTSIAVTTSAVTTPQTSWFRRFISPPLAGSPTSGSGNQVQLEPCTIRFAASESNANSDMMENGGIDISIWRPTTGAKVGTTLSVPGGTPYVTEPGTTETAITLSDATNGSFGYQPGDLLVIEIFSVQSQAMGVAYTNTFFYDGATEGSTTDNAGHIEFTNPIEFFSPRPIVNFQNPGVFMRWLPWHRRRSGIFVPDLPKLWRPKTRILAPA